MMTSRHPLGTASLALLAVVLASPGRAAAGLLVFSSSGPDAASITPAVNAFRDALGNPNNGNAPGPLPDGRREINWDGGGAATTVDGSTLVTFQNIRGATVTTPGTGFVQAPDTGLATQFGNPTYTATFEAFSAQRLFSPIGSNVSDVTFSIPGTGGAAQATVSGFGAIFSDVDLANTTSIEFFGTAGNSLGVFFAPAAPGTATFSFLGVDFGESIVARVRITTGNAAPGPNDGGTVDIVMMDDFLYSEPQAVVPEPTSLALLGVGAAGLLGYGRLRRTRAAAV